MRRWLLALLLLVLLSRTVWSDIQCDGTDDSMTTGVAISSFLTNSTGTIIAVIKHSGAIDAGSGCGRERITGDGNNLMGLTIDNSPEGFYAMNWTGAAACAGGTYVADTWKHLVWRHSGGNIELFIDGVLSNTVASGNSTSMTNPVHVCGTGDETGDFVNQAVALVEYYNVAWSDNEIAACGKSRLKRCGSRTATASWVFDQVTHGGAADGVGFVDRSGTGRTLTASDGANNTGMTGQGGSHMSYAVGAVQ